MHKNIILFNFKRALMAILISLLCAPSFADADTLNSKPKADNSSMKVMARDRNRGGDDDREEKIRKRREERERIQEERRKQQEQQEQKEQSNRDDEVRRREQEREQAQERRRQQEQAEQEQRNRDNEVRRREQEREEAQRRRQEEQDRADREQGDREDEVRRREQEREEAQRRRQEEQDRIDRENDDRNNDESREDEIRRREREREQAQEDRRRREEEAQRTDEERRQDRIRQREEERRRAQEERRRQEERARRTEEQRRERERVNQERENRREEIKKEQRRQARRNDRIRDEARREHRRETRDDYGRHAGEHRKHRRTIRRHKRWGDRYDKWRDNNDRWDRPTWPEDEITYPGEWPDSTDTHWTIAEIIDISDNIETQAAFNYNQIADLGYGKTKLGNLAYELWYAAQVYSDAVEFYNTNLCYSIYELFYLEKSMLEFETELNNHSDASKVSEHFKVSKYYINELLWQYRQQLGPIDQWRDLVDEGDDWRSQTGDQWDDISDTGSYGYFYFWWSKPHRVANWKLAEPIHIDSISIEASDTLGLRGKNGVAGVSKLILIYEDGSEYNLVKKNHKSYTRKSKQLVIKNEGDFVEVYNPHPKKLVKAIKIKADSWVAPDVDVELLVNLNSDMPSSTNFVELL